MTARPSRRLGVGAAAALLCAWALVVSPPAGASARVILLGHSVQGRAILARTVGPDSAPRRILLVGCLHGDECAGMAILRALSRRRTVAGVQLWLVSELNPDGTAAG